MGDPFGDTKDEQDNFAQTMAKRRGIVMAHQTLGKVAGVTGTAMIANAAKPMQGGRAYVSIRKSQLKSKGLKPAKKTVYFPERSPFRQIQAERKHFNRMHGKRVTRGPKKGQILRGDELRYYGSKRRQAKVGAGLVAYSRAAKPIGYGHAYGLFNRFGNVRYLPLMSAQEMQYEREQLEAGARRSHSNTERFAHGLAALSAGYAASGGDWQTVAGIALLEAVVR